LTPKVLASAMGAIPSSHPPPVAETAETRPAGMVVETEQVIAKKGPIPITGRYTCSRQLEEDFDISHTVLGVGMSGSVVLATGKDGRRYAVKSFAKHGLSVKGMQELKNEVELFLTLDHPHIVQLQMVFEAEDMLHLVMELMEGGELYDRLLAQKRYSEEAAADTTFQMLLAVAYLHAHNIAHRDLKLENWLYERKDTDHLKLIDFGFAKHWDPSTAMSQACGSIHYVAPEVLRHSYTVQADMWSLGILSYMLLTGSAMFSGSDSEVLRKVKSGQPNFSVRFKRLSAYAQNFVRGLLVRDPKHRLTAANALAHPWIQQRHLAAQGASMGPELLVSLRKFASASRFRRAALCMMAWSLTTEEQEGLREQFLQMDTNRSGSITLAELKAALEPHFEVDEAERLFHCLDADKSEEIEYSEFLAAALVGRVKAHGEVLRRTFARFDRDGSGLISSHELRAVLGDSFEGADIEELMREVDTSGDGMIDYEEFIAGADSPKRVARTSSMIDHLLGAAGPPMERVASAGLPSRKAQRSERRAITVALPVLLGVHVTSKQ